MVNCHRLQILGDNCFQGWKDGLQLSKEITNITIRLSMALYSKCPFCQAHGFYITLNKSTIQWSSCLVGMQETKQRPSGTHNSISFTLVWDVPALLQSQESIPEVSFLFSVDLHKQGCASAVPSHPWWLNFTNRWPGILVFGANMYAWHPGFQGFKDYGNPNSFLRAQPWDIL